MKPVALVLALVALGSAAPAFAQREPASDPNDPLDVKPAIGFSALDRPTGIAEAGFGWLTLPGASVCIERTVGCSNGDRSFALDVWQIVRGSRRFALGAGILLALIPTTEAPQAPPEQAPTDTPEAPGTATIERDHSRRYFTVEGIARYYPYVGENVEWWVGVTGGLVVVSDRFAVESDDTSERALLGPQGVTIRTEGGSIGIAGGPVVALAKSWAVGGTLRYGHWFLPEQPARDPLGSEASLTGRNTFFSFGLNLAYRMPL